MHGVHVWCTCIQCISHLSEKDPWERQEWIVTRYTYNLSGVYQAQSYYEQCYDHVQAYWWYTMMPCHTMTCHTTPCHAIPYHATPHPVISCHRNIMSCLVTSYNVTSHYAMSHHIMSHHIISCHMLSCHVMTCHIMWHHVMLHYVMSCHITSHHVMSCYVTSHHVMSSHAMSCHVMPCHAIPCRYDACTPLQPHCFSMACPSSHCTLAGPLMLWPQYKHMSLLLFWHR